MDLKNLISTFRLFANLSQLQAWCKIGQHRHLETFRSLTLCTPSHLLPLLGGHSAWRGPGGQPDGGESYIVKTILQRLTFRPSRYAIPLLICQPKLRMSTDIPGA